MDDALSFIEQVVTERVTLVSWWHDDRWCGSADRPPGAELDEPMGAPTPSFNRVRVRSWRGIFNVDIIS